jgi:uncharacterized membrane-anchored protein
VPRFLRPLLLCLSLLVATLSPLAMAADDTQAAESQAQRAFDEAVARLDWVKGPATVDVGGNSKLALPEGYAFLDQRNTDKFLELTRNVPSGQEVLVARQDLKWVAYLSFSDEGYVKDDEKIDADALLKALQDGAKEGNKERRSRGFPELQITGWAVPPAYNNDTKRLEWATILRSDGGEGVNFSTKVLGRRGHTSVILVTGTDGLATARPQLDSVLGGYSFVDGERYADWVPGDKVATYGLAALVLGGAAAIATKKGLWAVIAGFVVAKAKLLIGGAIALAAGARRFLTGRKKADDGR